MALYFIGNMKPKIEKRYIGLFLPICVLIVIFLILLVSFNMGDLDSTLDPYILLSIVLLFLFIVLVLAIIVLYLMFINVFSRKRDILEIGPEEIRKMNDAELGDLLHRLEIKKTKIEYMLKIAKSKYHKREMDEESLREITKENQEKLLRIEVKMKELGDQINKVK